MAKVLVVGSGPAGLAAAEALAGKDGIEVTLLTLGHILGGKACSWETDDGFTVEHGQHVMLGFYDEMRALLRRAGVDPDRTSVSSNGRYTIYEDRDEAAHELHLGPSTLETLVDGLEYTGWSFSEKASFAASFIAMAPRVIAGVPESLDDVCLTAWCLLHGFPASLVATNAFRASREAQLNWPGEISAYAMLKTIKIAGRDYTSSEARFPAGGMSRIWWDPIAARIEALGGTIVRSKKLTGIAHTRGAPRLAGLSFADPLPHDPSHPYVDRGVPTRTGSGTLWEADAAIIAVPPPCLAEVVSGDPVLSAMPLFSNIDRLTTIAPLGLHVWHRNAPNPSHRGVVCGLPPPLGFVLDNKPHYPQYRSDARFGAALHFVGQETLFEEDDDETLLDRALASIRRIPGYERMDREGVLRFEVVRNRGPHKRYWNAEPGSLRFKPTPETPVEGLFLAGDWVRTELDFPCMENAVRSGLNAARLVRKHLAGRAA